MTAKQEIGRRHRTMREDVLAMSVATYARQMGIKEVTVYSWESGRTAVPQAILARLDADYGIDVRWLLSGEGTMRRTAGTAADPITRLEQHVVALQDVVREIKRHAPDVLAGAGSRGRRRPYRIPMLSLGVSAGAPTASDDTIEREIDLAEMLLEHPESSYFIRVVGDSMIDAGIADGDTLIVDCAVQPRPGQVVIARVYGELTVKRYMVDGAMPRLRAENRRYKDIVITADMDFAIVGVVRSCIKQF